MITNPQAYIESIKANARTAKQRGINGYVINERAAIGSEIKRFVNEEHAKMLAKSFGDIKTTSIPVETLFHIAEQGRYDLIFFSKATGLENSTHVKIKDYYFAGNVVVVCFDKVKGIYLDVPPVINTLSVIMEYLSPDRVPADKKMSESGLNGYVSKSNEDNRTEKIQIALIDPFSQSIELKLMDNSYDGFRTLMGGPVAFKRLPLVNMSEIIGEKNRESDDFLNSFSCINGINLAVHDAGIVLNHPTVAIGMGDYTLCHGKVIMSGADEKWNDIDLPYKLSFIKNIVFW